MNSYLKKDETEFDDLDEYEREVDEKSMKDLYEAILSG